MFLALRGLHSRGYDGASPKTGGKNLSTGLLDLQHIRACTALLSPAYGGASPKTGGKSLSTGILDLQHIRACTALLSPALRRSQPQDWRQKLEHWPS